MRAVEAAAIESGAATGRALMERAGRGVVQAVFDAWPQLQLTSYRAVILCGPGNNGGDDFVVARLLHGWGWDVDVYLYGASDKLPPDAKANHDRWAAIGSVAAWDDAAIADVVAEGDHALILDALFGTGLVRPMPQDTARSAQSVAQQVQAANPARRAKFVAVDIPSGLCSDSGQNLGGAFPADLSVSFHAAKLGHFLLPKGPSEGGAAMCGKVVIADIGIARTTDAARVQLATGQGAAPRKGAGGHKYAHGHALILSGGMGRSGAARLAARGALRIGAGVVTVGAPKGAMAECAGQLTAIMLRQVDGAADLQAMLGDDRINALCVGPGLGLGTDQAGVLGAALNSGRACVLDADALSLIAGEPDLFAALHGACVLTPHAGEFARLFPDIADRLNAPATSGPAYSKVDATRAAAARAGCVVLFKGPDTVIAAPDGTCVLNAALYDNAAPWLATAGAGDVLAGFIAGQMAQSAGPMEAATAAAWLHVQSARQFGPGLIAEDLPEVLPEVLKQI